MNFGRKRILLTRRGRTMESKQLSKVLSAKTSYRNSSKCSGRQSSGFK